MNLDAKQIVMLTRLIDNRIRRAQRNLDATARKGKIVAGRNVDEWVIEKLAELKNALLEAHGAVGVDAAGLMRAGALEFRGAAIDALRKRVAETDQVSIRRGLEIAYGMLMTLPALADAPVVDPDGAVDWL